MVKRKLYVLISDDTGKYWRAKQQVDGSYSFSQNAQPYPINFNPSNLVNSEVDFGTNAKYFSLTRTVTQQLNFIKDGAAILKQLYYFGKGIEQKAYITILQWNGIRNVYELAYHGRVDFNEKKGSPKSNTFSVPCVDDSAWGVLSQNDDTKYYIDCSPTNPKAIKVLVDGLNLVDTLTYQTVAITIDPTIYIITPISLVLINQSGDTVGVVSKGQNLQSAPISVQGEVKLDYVNTNIVRPKGYTPPSGIYQTLPIPTQGSGFYYTAYRNENVNIEGQIQFSCTGTYLYCPIYYFVTNKGQYVNLFNSYQYLINNKVNIANFNFNITLDEGEEIYLMTNNALLYPITLGPVTTILISNIAVTSKTKVQPQVVYGLRPLDLLQQIVETATNGRFSINSIFFEENNRDIITSGDAIRNVPSARIYTSFSDFFKTFDARYFMALRIINGNLWIEPADVIYNFLTGNIIELGEAIDISEPEVAQEFYGNSLEVGSPSVDYRHPSGRLEFDSTNQFSLPFTTVNKKLSWITAYRTGCFDISFLILDYQGGSTVDNTGDTSCYLLRISDEQASAVEQVENFELVNIDDMLLEPIIKYPVNNSVIAFNKPRCSGIAPSGSNVNIYVDNVLDGNCTADTNGNWVYDITTALSTYVLGVTTGLHIIDATFTDESAPKTTSNILVDTSSIQPLLIDYPEPNDSLYNNKPLIKGRAIKGTVLAISIDGTNVGSTTADGSGNWFYQSGVISNGSHTLTVGAVSQSFNVNSSTEFPLITYIGSELDGFPIITNLPLIKGVAIPFTQINLWLNYIEYIQLGVATSDANGNWQFQVIPVSYTDPISHLPVTVAPIPNGANVIIVTNAQPVNSIIFNQVVNINVSGYKLERPNFSSITGVTDNTVFNTHYSPMRCLLGHKSMLSAIMNQQIKDKITFQIADKNGNLRTVLGNEIIAENANVQASSLGNKIALLEYMTIKTKTSETFANTLYNFSNGGVIHVTYRGNDLYFLPIGSMKIKTITDDVQEWRLLMAPNNTYNTIANLYKNGLTIKLNKDTMFHSDYNSLHFVEYNFQDNPQFNFKEIYQDWFNNRNDAWILNPDYIQKFQTTEIIKDQIEINAIGNIELRMFRCIDGRLVDTIPYNVPANVPPNLSNVVLEAVINFGNYPPNFQYFFVVFSNGIPISISERIYLKTKWLGTILVDAGSSINQVGFYYSTGIRTIIRVEGLVKKWQPNLNYIVATEESGDTEALYQQVSRQRVIRYGTAYGLPDYLSIPLSDASTLDDFKVEGVGYTLDQSETMSPSDDVDGHPLYYYNIKVHPKENLKGAQFTGGGQTLLPPILTVDSQAIGLPAGTVINITLDEETT